MAAVETDERRPASAGRRLNSTFIARREFGIFLVLVALILYFNARNSAFTSSGNWATLVEYGSPILIAAVGETMLLICGEIDLSVGHVYALAPLVLYQVGRARLAADLGLLAGLVVSALVGLTNGLVTVYLRVPSLIVTLGMFNVLNGISLLISDGSQQTTPTGPNFGAIVRRRRLPHVLLGLRAHAGDALRAHDDALGAAHDRRRRQPRRRERERRQRELDPHRQLRHVQRARRLRRHPHRAAHRHDRSAAGRHEPDVLRRRRRGDRRHGADGRLGHRDRRVHRRRRADRAEQRLHADRRRRVLQRPLHRHRHPALDGARLPHRTRRGKPA